LPQLPTSLALPSNVLVLDIMAFERNLLREAQARAEPSAPTRSHTLNSLRALLGVLEIPIPPHAPIHNAGNDAFYTLLAFQRLVDGGVEIPSMLYAQPSFHPPYASSHSLSPSASNQRLSSYTPPSKSPPTSAAPSPRQRPLSLGYASARSTNDGAHARRSKPPMQRSQTVFWTEADYGSPANVRTTEPSPRGSLGLNKSRESPGQTRISWMDLEEDPGPSPTTSTEGTAPPKSAMKRTHAPPSAMRPPEPQVHGHERARRKSEGALVESPSLTIPRTHATLGPRRPSNLSSSSSAALVTPPPLPTPPPAAAAQDSGSSGGSGLEIAVPAKGKKDKKKRERGIVGTFAKMWTG
jgi:hypothetical protein